MSDIEVLLWTFCACRVKISMHGGLQGCLRWESALVFNATQQEVCRWTATPLVTMASSPSIVSNGRTYKPETALRLPSCASWSACLAVVRREACPWAAEAMQALLEQ